MSPLNNIYDEVAQILRELLFLPADSKIPLNAKAGEFENWDSLVSIMLLLRVEQHYAIRLESKSVARLRDLQSLIDLVAEKVREPRERGA